MFDNEKVCVLLYILEINDISLGFHIRCCPDIHLTFLLDFKEYVYINFNFDVLEEVNFKCKLVGLNAGCLHRKDSLSQHMRHKLIQNVSLPLSISELQLNIKSLIQF